MNHALIHLVTYTAELDIVQQTIDKATEFLDGHVSVDAASGQWFVAYPEDNVCFPAYIHLWNLWLVVMGTIIALSAGPFKGSTRIFKGSTRLFT